jgi:hypothetical protein
MVVYHYFEQSKSQFVLYDDDMDMPIAYGSRNLVDAAIRKLPKSITVIYYQRDMRDKLSYKKRYFYQGQKEDRQTS